MAKLVIYAHCQDRCVVFLEDDHGVRHEHEGYVPSGLGIGGGDSIDLEIDLETGQITGWKKPTEERLLEVFGAKEGQP